LNSNSLLNPNKLIFAGEISDSLFVSGQQREGNQHNQGTQGKLRKANYPPDTSEKTHPDTSSLMGGRTRKTPKIKGKLQEINLLGSVFSHKDIEINLNTPLGCSSTYLGLSLLLKTTKTQDKQFTRETG